MGHGMVFCVSYKGTTGQRSFGHGMVFYVSYKGTKGARSMGHGMGCYASYKGTKGARSMGAYASVIKHIYYKYWILKLFLSPPEMNTLKTPLIFLWLWLTYSYMWSSHNIGWFFANRIFNRIFNRIRIMIQVLIWGPELIRICRTERQCRFERVVILRRQVDIAMAMFTQTNQRVADFQFTVPVGNTFNWILLYRGFH